MPSHKSFLATLIVAPLIFTVFVGSALGEGNFTGRRCNTERTDCRVACVAWQNDPPGSLEGCRSDCAADYNECVAGGGEASSVGPSSDPAKPNLSPKQKQGGGLSVKP